MTRLQRLNRIADALGIDRDVFMAADIVDPFPARDESHETQVRELLQHLAAAASTDGQDRRRVLRLIAHFNAAMA